MTKIPKLHRQPYSHQRMHQAATLRILMQETTTHFDCTVEERQPNGLIKDCCKPACLILELIFF